MVIRQLTSIVFFSNLVKWDKFSRWFFRHSFRSLPVSAGAIGMGCIGFPNHPVWEVTQRCNLRCLHCHTDGGTEGQSELDTAEGKKLLDGLAKIKEFRMLVFTGGEPMVRDDIFDLLYHSKKAGFVNVMATNGTLIEDDTARELKKAGVSGIAVSLDSSIPSVHNKIRRRNDAFSKALRGIEAIKKNNMLLQINTTAMEYNLDNLDELISFADDLGSSIMLMYQLVPVGRGCAIVDASLRKEKNQNLIEFLAQKQKDIDLIVETVAGPQYWPYLMEKNKKNRQRDIKIAQRYFHGCTAGRGLVYIKSNGDVWPCPFVELDCGNVRKQDISDIWKNNDVFLRLREREKYLKGKCGECKYNILCGGCRGRALATTGDYMQEDISCFIEL